MYRLKQQFTEEEANKIRTRLNPNPTTSDPNYIWMDDLFEPIPKERWKPKRGETFFGVIVTGDIYEYVWIDSEQNIACYEQGNCFKTRTEAEAAAEKIKQLLLTLHNS